MANNRRGGRYSYPPHSNGRRGSPPFRPSTPETVVVPPPCEPRPCPPPNPEQDCRTACPPSSHHPSTLPPAPPEKAPASDLIGGILDKLKSLLSKLLGRPAEFDDLLLVGLIVVILLENRKKKKEPGCHETGEEGDLEILLVMLAYLLF